MSLYSRSRHLDALISELEPEPRPLGDEANLFVAVPYLLYTALLEVGRAAGVTPADLLRLGAMDLLANIAKGQVPGNPPGCHWPFDCADARGKTWSQFTGVKPCDEVRQVWAETL